MNIRCSRLTAVLIAVCAAIAAGGILASNLGFALPYALPKTGTNGSKSGISTLGLPYIRRAGLSTAYDLIRDIEGGGPPFSKVANVGKYLVATDSMQLYSGRMGSPGANFTLVPGEGYRVQMSADVNAYVIVGAHNSSQVITLYAPGSSSKSGTNDFAPPYNATAATAYDLIRDIEGGGPPFSKVVNVGKYLVATDSLQLYSGRMGSAGANFTLTAGESYRIQLSAPVNGFISYTPSVYPSPN